MKILCPDCNKRYSELSTQFGELHEFVEGKSKGEFLCDGCGMPNYIHVGDTCFATVTLPNRNHFNYQIQKPDVWMDDYLTPTLNFKQ